MKMYIKKTEPEILLVGFGDLSVLESDFKKTFTGYRVISAKTAAEGLIRAKSDAVLIQPVYLLPGFEYDRLCAEATGCGRKMVVGKPLLASDETITALAKILIREYGQKPTFFAGHGSHHPLGEAVYARLADILREVGFAEAFVGVLEGRPDFDSVIEQIRKKGISDIALAPLTLTAGKHVKEDIFGEDESSWQSRLRASGFFVTPLCQTLLGLSAVRQMFVELCRFAL